MSSVWMQYRRYMHNLVTELTLSGSLDSFLQLAILWHFCATWPPDRAQIGWIHGLCTEIKSFCPALGDLLMPSLHAKSSPEWLVHCTSLSCGTKLQLVRHAQDPLPPPPPHPVLCLFGTCAHSQLCVGCQKLIPSRVCYTCVSIKHDVSAVQPLHFQVPVQLCATGGEILLNRKFPIWP